MSKIFIVGTMRSGSSALAGVLKRVGYRLHDDLLKPNSLTPNGCHESKAVTRLNDSILAELGSCWNSMLPLPRGWIGHPNYHKWVSRAVELLGGVDVVKDPRMARLLPVWLDAVEDLGDDPPKILITHRGLLTTVKSTMRLAPAFSPNAALAFWGSVHADLFDVLSDYDPMKIFVSLHHLLMDDWVNALEDLRIFREEHSRSREQERDVARFLERPIRPSWQLPEEVYDRHLLIAAGFLEESLLNKRFNQSSLWRDAISLCTGWSTQWAVGRCVPLVEDPEEEAEQRRRECQVDPTLVRASLSHLLRDQLR